MLESNSEKVKTFSPKSLGTQSRSTINRIVRREDIDSLPLPRIIKDECFANITLDRSEKPDKFCELLPPCEKGCCSFDASNQRYEIPQWSESDISAGLHLAYLQTLPGLLTDAEWLKLPSISDDSSTDFTGKDLDELASYNTLRFDSSTGLGQVHLWINRFLRYKDIYSWYDVSIPADCMKSFLENIKNLSIVMLPYGCVSSFKWCCTAEEKCNFRCHKRQMILVVPKCNEIILEMEQYDTGCLGNKFINRIENVFELIKSIDYVSSQQSRYKKYDIIFNPVIPHAIWWMALLVPNGLDFFVRDCRKYLTRRTDVSNYYEIANCIVYLDPLNQCIGDPIQNLQEHVIHKNPFVFWLRDLVLNVKEMDDYPVSDNLQQQFMEWSRSRRMNTLLNLNDDSWVDPLPIRERHVSLYRLKKYSDF